MTSRASLACASALLAGMLVTGCESEDSEPPSSEKPVMVDGKVCGYVDPALVEEALGPGDVLTLNEGIASKAERVRRPQECSISHRGSTQFLSVSVSEGRPPPQLDKRQPNCSRPKTPDGWWLIGVCDHGDSLLASGWPPEEGRFIRLGYSGLDPKQKQGNIALLVKVFEDVNDNVNAFDASHGEQ